MFHGLRLDSVPLPFDSRGVKVALAVTGYDPLKFTKLLLGTQQRTILMAGLARTPQLLFYQLRLGLTSIFKALGGFDLKDWIVLIA